METNPILHSPTHGAVTPQCHAAPAAVSVPSGAAALLYAPAVLAAPVLRAAGALAGRQQACMPAPARWPRWHCAARSSTLLVARALPMQCASHRPWRRQLSLEASRATAAQQLGEVGVPSWGHLVLRVQGL